LRAVEDVKTAAGSLGLKVVNTIESPIQGAEGNIEFLVHFVRFCG
jgi:predicted rRNA methylase YqxC with S4 and FtsJ domains